MVEDRKTFTVPDGYEAIRDSEGRATGEIRLTYTTLEAKLAEVTKERDEARAKNRDLNRRVSVVEAGRQQRSDIHHLWAKEYIENLKPLEAKAEAAEARASALEERVKGLETALLEITEVTEVHTKLNQERLCCKFQHIARAALTGGKDG